MKTSQKQTREARSEDTGQAQDKDAGQCQHPDSQENDRGSNSRGSARGFQGIGWALVHAPASDDAASSGAAGGEEVREEFDVVMVCNGHYRSVRHRL